MLELYILFATSVAFWACYELMRPALYLVKDKKQDVLYNNKILAYIAMFCVAWIAAPFTVLCILNSNLNATVVATLIDGEKY